MKWIDKILLYYNWFNIKKRKLKQNIILNNKGRKNNIKNSSIMIIIF